MHRSSAHLRPPEQAPHAPTGLQAQPSREALRLRTLDSPPTLLPLPLPGMVDIDALRQAKLWLRLVEVRVFSYVFLRRRRRHHWSTAADLPHRRALCQPVAAHLPSLTLGPARTRPGEPSWHSRFASRPTPCPQRTHTRCPPTSPLQLIFSVIVFSLVADNAAYSRYSFALFVGTTSCVLAGAFLWGCLAHHPWAHGRAALALDVVYACFWLGCAAALSATLTQCHLSGAHAARLRAAVAFAWLTW